jgi:thiamine pyrophosphokinase
VPRPATAIVFAGGDPLGVEDHRQLRAEVGGEGGGPDGRAPDRFVIAADSGLHHAQDGGWPVDLVIGDLDSVDPERLARAQAAGARLERHPAAKAATDLELALDTARDRGVQRIVVAGGHGGRTDHLLANVLLLGSARYAEVSVSARLGSAWVHIVRDHAWWTGERGDLVTLLALHGPAVGVTTDGLLYPLDDDTLHPGSTRGVSNEHVVAAAAVSLTSGVLAVVVPGAKGTHALTTDPDSVDPAVVAAPAATDPVPPATGRPPAHPTT